MRERPSVRMNASIINVIYPYTSVVPLSVLLRIYDV
nr:MAG TPA: hypothetical protein [Caudoviricetes sp.]